MSERARSRSPVKSWIKKCPGCDGEVADDARVHRTIKKYWHLKCWDEKMKEWQTYSDGASSSSPWQCTGCRSLFGTDDRPIYSSSGKQWHWQCLTKAKRGEDPSEPSTTSVRPTEDPSDPSTTSVRPTAVKTQVINLDYVAVGCLNHCSYV